jgi:hypothetical protein
MKCPRASVVVVTVSDGELIRNFTPGIGWPVVASVIVPAMPPLVPASAQVPWLKKTASNPSVKSGPRSNDVFMDGFPSSREFIVFAQIPREPLWVSLLPYFSEQRGGTARPGVGM